jgi:ankyrin repeat protein
MHLWRGSSVKLKCFVSALSLLTYAGACAQSVQQSPDQRLISAAQQGDVKEMREALAAGANPNVKDEKGKAAIELVSLDAHIYDRAKTRAEIDARLLGVEILVRRGAKIKVNLEEYFPIEIVNNAIYEGRYDLAQYLVEKGGHPSALNVWSLVRTPRFPTSNPNTIRRKLFEKALAKTFRIQKANPLVYAVSSDDAFYFTRRLLEAGFEPNRRSIVGGTPLLAAIAAKRADIVELLIKYKADVNQQYKAPKSSYATIERLWEGKSPLQVAQEANLPKIVDLLKKAGAV